jgi:hypothetical protein
MDYLISRGPFLKGGVISILVFVIKELGAPTRGGLFLKKGY